MTAPERIYRDETGLWSRNTAAFSTFSEVRVSPTGVEYIRADIHEAEIDALKAEISHLCAEAFQSDLDALKVANQQLMDEMAALKMPPKVLSAEDVEEEGWYWSVDNEEFVQIDCDPTILPWQLSMWRVSSSVCSRLQDQFIGPIQMPEVCDAG